MLPLINNSMAALKPLGKYTPHLISLACGILAYVFVSMLFVPVTDSNNTALDSCNALALEINNTQLSAECEYDISRLNSLATIIPLAIPIIIAVVVFKTYTDIQKGLNNKKNK